MKTLKNYGTMVWSWIYERTALWIILFVGLTFMVSLNDLSIQSSKIEKEGIECKISCHPGAYEHIPSNSKQPCWCYQNEATLTPVVLHK